MATIGGELQNRVAAVWRRAPIPEGFGDTPSSAPLSGKIDLPLHIWWSGEETPELNLSDRDDRRFAYQLILSYGTAADVEALVHPAQLVADWDELFLTAAVAELWVPWYKRYRELCR